MENLHEIFAARDETKRNALEGQLDELSAQLIENLGDSADGEPYRPGFKVVYSAERRRIHDEAMLYSPIGAFGFADMLQKMIGGISSKSYEEIFRDARQSLTIMLDTAIDGIPDGIDRKLFMVKKAITLQEFERVTDDLLRELDMHQEMRLPELDHVHAANFSGERTVEKLFALAEESDASLVVKTFLSDIPVLRREAHKMRPTRDQIFRLAQTLFFLRYRREAKNMGDSERARADFQGSLTDLIHIANASVCSIFHTSDHAQAQIAAATYDHLNISTAILHHSSKSDADTAIYRPAQVTMLA